MSDTQRESVEAVETAETVEATSSEPVETAEAAALPESDDLGDGATVMADPELEAIETNRRDLDRAIAELGNVTLAEASRSFSSGFIGGRVLPADLEEPTENTSSGYPWRDVSTPEELGEMIEDGDEDESVALEAAEDEVSEDVVYDIAVAAASTGRDFDGPMLAEYFAESGPITDVRLAIAIGVLRLGQKLTGDRLLGVLESIGFVDEAGAARIARDALAKMPEVAVEVMTALPASMGES